MKIINLLYKSHNIMYNFRKRSKIYEKQKLKNFVSVIIQKMITIIFFFYFKKTERKLEKFRIVKSGNFIQIKKDVLKKNLYLYLIKYFYKIILIFYQYRIILYDYFLSIQFMFKFFALAFFFYKYFVNNI